MRIFERKNDLLPKTVIIRTSLIALFFIFMVFLYRVARMHFGSFGCFDDCFNYMGAFLMLKGKTLYSQIFFNHQMGMAYLSYLIQLFGHPQTLYQLILDHRIFIFVFGFLMDCFLIARFGFIGFSFGLFYESTKYYIFGDRFLAEAMIPYLFVYLSGLLWYKVTKKPIYDFELILSGIFTWFIIFTREPFIPAACIVYLGILWNKKISRTMIFSISVFIFLSLLSVFTVSIKDYFFNVYTINQKTELKYSDFSPLGMVKIFAYPFYVLFRGEKNIFRIILVTLSSLFIFISIAYGVFRNKLKPLFLFFFLLGLTNIRFVDPGLMYYAAFHQLIWYGIFIFLIFLLLETLYEQRKHIIVYGGYCVFICLFFFNIFSPYSYIHERINGNYDFTTNYGNEYSYGQVVKILAAPKDTLFLDGRDDLIYWQADHISTYQYGWYTSVMPYFSLYRDARIAMFHRSPPDFYYGECINTYDKAYHLPLFIKSAYAPLYFDNKQTCLFVKRIKISAISRSQWHQVNQMGYYLRADKQVTE